MKPCTFFVSVLTLIFVLIIGYVYSHTRATPLYSGEAKSEALCGELTKLESTGMSSHVVNVLTNSFCTNEVQNRLQNVVHESDVRNLQVSLTHQGRVLTWLRDADISSQGVVARIIRFARFFYDTLMHGNELPFTFDPQQIAWYASSRNLGSSVAALMEKNTAFAVVLQDLSREYRVSLASFAARIHEVHVVKFAGDNDIALIVRDPLTEHLADTGAAIEELVAHVLAATFPQELVHRLPDSSSVTELMFDPTRFVFVPQHQGSLEVRVLRDDAHHIVLYTTTIGNRFMMTTSQKRLQELIGAPRQTTLWNAISRGCNNYSSSVADDGIFLNFAQGFWYGAHDAHDMHTIAGCFMDATWLGRISDHQKLTSSPFHL